MAISKQNQHEFVAIANGDDGISEAISQWAERMANMGILSPKEIADFRDGVWSLGIFWENNA